MLFAITAKHDSKRNFEYFKVMSCGVCQEAFLCGVRPG